jgi:alpha-1,2-mannosyltransferase
MLTCFCGINSTYDLTALADLLLVWMPSSFRRPSASPYPSWSVTSTKPLPYRPFRYGPKYNITMGLRSMHWDDWFELDNEFIKFYSIKVARIAERGGKCCKTAPEARAAAIELLEELCAYLPERYPSLFQVLGSGRAGVNNLITGETIDIKESLEVNMEDPMQVCARLVQDDLAIMIEVRRRSITRRWSPKANQA